MILHKDLIEGHSEKALKGRSRDCGFWDIWLKWQIQRILWTCFEQFLFSNHNPWQRVTLGSIYCSCHFCFILCFFSGFDYCLKLPSQIADLAFVFEYVFVFCRIIAWFHLHLPILLTWQLPNGGHLSLSFSVFAENFLLTIYWLNGRMQSIWKLIEEEFVFQMKRDLFGMKWVPIQISFTTKPHICHFPPCAQFCSNLSTHKSA